MRWFPDDMPAPAADHDSLPFWEAAAEHRLVLQRCAACGRFRHPPGPVCPRCHSTAQEWPEVPGRGVVYSFTVVARAPMPTLRAHVPYVVAAIELDGVPDARLVSALVEVPPEDVCVGMRVELVWEDRAPDLAVPLFRPA